MLVAIGRISKQSRLAAVMGTTYKFKITWEGVGDISICRGTGYER
jgi:hypothetical protein